MDINEFKLGIFQVYFSNPKAADCTIDKIVADVDELTEKLFCQPPFFVKMEQQNDK